jgi:hypothetical protein
MKNSIESFIQRESVWPDSYDDGQGVARSIAGKLPVITELNSYNSVLRKTWFIRRLIWK